MRRREIINWINMDSFTLASEIRYIFSLWKSEFVRKLPLIITKPITNNRSKGRRKKQARHVRT